MSVREQNAKTQEAIRRRAAERLAIRRSVKALKDKERSHACK